MIGIQLDPQRMAAIAEALRSAIPKASPEVARPMIDAAGELQRIVDAIRAAQERSEKFIEELLRQATVTGCDRPDCPACTARRAAAGTAKPESLN